MKNFLLIPVLTAVALIAVESSARAQTRIVTQSGSSFSSRQSSSWSAGPGGFQSHSQSSGHASQWGSVQIDSRSPVNSFSGSFSAGSSRSWDVQRGQYAGPFGAGSYGSVQTDRSVWNQGRWIADTYGGGQFGGSYRNFDRDTRSRTWSRQYP